ncbi:MAG: phosphoribosylglycinamide formyltransferase [Myxococcota bacterium]
MIRVVALVSGRGSNLNAIRGGIDEGTIDARIVGVVADRNAPALELAAERGTPTKCVPLRKGDDRDAWNLSLADAVAGFDPDLVVLAGFMRIVAPSFVARFPRRIVNVHPSLLPSFPGARAPAQALKAGVRVSGCTVHLVDEGVDTGTILAQGVVPVRTGDTADTLHARIQTIEHRLLPAVVRAIAAGTLDLDTAQWSDDSQSVLAAP